MNKSVICQKKMKKRKFDASLFHHEKYVTVTQNPKEIEYVPDDYSKFKKYFVPEATDLEKQRFEEDLDDFATKQVAQPEVVRLNRLQEEESPLIEFTRLAAYDGIPDDIYEKIRHHQFLLFCEQGLEDVQVEFRDDEDLERYLRSMAGVEPNINQDAEEREKTRTIECRFVTKVVQQAELDDLEEYQEEEEAEDFDGTTLKGSESITSIKEASSLDDLSSTLEDYCIVEVYYDTDPLMITGWRFKITQS